MNIRFRFDPEKLVHALAYFSERGISDLSKMKAAKLLFYADKYHLLKYGRPVIGDQYVCMEYGPVPSLSLDVMNDAIENDADFPPLAKELFDEYIEIERPRFRRRPHPIFKAKKPADRDVFSDSDIEALDWAIANFGRKTASQLSAESHDERLWKIADACRKPGSSVFIDYRLFFEDEPGAAEMLRFVEAQQQDRDFAESLSR